ncbi:MAG TPA: hypothetical protein VF530_07690 [Planctomycetota bacterium]
MERQRIFDSATIALFVLALLGPALDQCMRPDAARDSSNAEQRAPAALPELPRTSTELASFPRRYEDHYDDTFGLRDVLLRWNGIERALWLGVSPASTIALADEGWCFYLGEKAREAHRGLLPFSEAELDGWVKRLRERRDFLARLGSKYLFVPCPSKNVIYPERTGPGWEQLGPTRLEQLLLRLEREGDIPFLDLRPALRAAKEDDQFEDWVYTRCGTHWNGRGIYAACQAILTRLQADFPELALLPPREACKVVEQKNSTESLSRQLYLADLLPQRQYSYQSAKRGYEVLLETPPRTGSRLVTRKNGSAPRLLWLHDSFGPFHLLCESFSYVDAQRVFEFSTDAVRAARPDIVLETYVDRVLNYQQPYRAMVGSKTTPEEEFARLKDLAWREELGDRFPAPQPFGRAQLEREEDALVLYVSRPKDGVLLPAVVLKGDQRASLRITARCDQPIEIEIYVRAAGTSTFEAQNLLSLQLRPGAPSGTVHLPRVGARFETLVRPRSPVGELRITALELRRGPAR